MKFQKTLGMFEPRPPEPQREPDYDLLQFQDSTWAKTVVFRGQDRRRPNDNDLWLLFIYVPLLLIVLRQISPVGGTFGELVYMLVVVGLVFVFLKRWIMRVIPVLARAPIKP